jgi:Methylmalonyl-CoA mutase
MSTIPDFTNINLDAPVSGAAPAIPAGVWETPEGIAVKPVYTGADTAGLDFLDGLPGIAPYVRGPYPAMYALGSRRRKIQTLSTAAISPPGRKASPSPSISQPIAAMTQITRASRAMSAWRVSPSIAFSICGHCSTAFRSPT